MRKVDHFDSEWGSGVDFVVGFRFISLLLITLCHSHHSCHISNLLPVRAVAAALQIFLDSVGPPRTLERGADF
jgi:hypothetical protein